MALAFFCLIAFNGSLQARNYYAQSLGGATGLINTPTAHTGWDGSDLGIDAGFSALTVQDAEFIMRLDATLFKMLELGYTYDNQDGKHDNDWFLHGKFCFYGPGNAAIKSSGNSALAIGGNYQATEDNNQESNHGQLYLAATYGGTFFSLPAETTIVVGKTFGNDIPHSDIDFSMGFDLDMFPSVLKGYVHWINDFSNYAYQVNTHDFDNDRGIYSTGARLIIPIMDRFKINVDALLIDLLDDTREFGVTVSAGAAIL